VNLNDTPSAGPLVAADMHRVTVMHAGLDYQGRHQTRPMPAEACTELGHEDDPYDGTAVIRGLFSALAITAILAAVVVALV
jgi:hypothetical protein